MKIAPAGITLNELLAEHCGGLPDGHRLYAWLPGGASGGILPASLADVPLACIQCIRCLRACREEQGHKVIGLAYRAGAARILFHTDVPIGDSSCVSCMACVRVCPTGALAAVRRDSG